MKNKWKTTLMGILGVSLMVIRAINPDFLSEGAGVILTDSIDAIITAVLSFIAVFSAKDEVDSDNIA